MKHITVGLPDQVAETYEQAAQQLADHLGIIGQNPDARTLMRFVLSSMSAEQIAAQFDFVLRNLTGAPMPEEPEEWLFSPQFENAP